MSLANASLVPVPASPNTGQLEALSPKYGGLKIIERQFDIKGGTKNWGANVEDWVFDEYGTRDGESTCAAEVLKDPNEVRADMPYPDCYLEAQWIRSGERTDNDSRVVKRYFEAYDTLREWEKPVVSFDENGRRIEDRTFIVLNSAGESAWKSVPGETDAFVASDMVADTEEAEIGNAVTIIKRRYVQATDAWAQVGGDRLKVGPNNLLQVFREYVASPGTSNDPLRTGADPTTVEGTQVFLADVDIRERAGYKLATRKWMEAGFVDRSEDFVGSQKAITITAWKVVPAPSDAGAGYALARKRDSDYQGFPTREYTFLRPSVLRRGTRLENAGKIKRQTVTAFFETPVADFSPAIEIEDREDDEEGIPTKTKVWVGGSGRISTETETRNNGNLTITTIRFVEADDQSKPSGVLTQERSQTQDGLTLYTEVYANGDGEVGREETEALDGAVTYVRITSLGTKVAAPGEFETGERTDDGYVVHTSRGIVVNYTDLPSEIWTRNGGKLQFTRLRKIDSAPSGTGLKVGESISERDGFTLYEATYVDVTGEGEIGRDVDHRLDGAVTYTTVRSLNSVPSVGGTIVDESSDERDYYTVHSRTGLAVNRTEVSKVSWEENGGKLKYEKIRNIDGPGTGSGKKIDHRVSPQKGFILHTTVHLEVQPGEYRRDEEEILDGAVKYITIHAFDQHVAAPGEFDHTEDGRDHYTVHVSRGVEVLDPELGQETRTERGNVEVTVVRRVNGPGSATGNMVQERIDERRGFSIYTSVFVDGTSGRLERRQREGPVPGSIEETIVSLDQEEPTGELVADESTERDGYTVYRKTAVSGLEEGEIYSYQTPVEVDVPGEVKPTTVSVSNGTIATVEVKRPTRRTVIADAKISIETGEPPGLSDPAFNMDGIACSVTFTQERDSHIGWVTDSGANASASSAIRRTTSSARVQTFEGCSLVSEEASGQQTFNGGSGTDYIDTKVFGAGTMVGEVSGIYKETGVIRRRARHLLTTVDGTKYWEVLTLEV